MNREKIGVKLKEAREKLGLKQEVLSRDLQISVKTIQRAEKGEKSVKESILIQLGEFLSVEVVEEGFLALHEDNTFKLLVENETSIEIRKKDDLNEEQLKLLIKLFETLEKKYDSIVEKLKKELSLKSIFKNLNEQNIKIYGVVFKDGEFDYDYDYSDYYIREIETLNLFIYKSTSPQIKKLQNKKTYIEFPNENYFRLKESITSLEMLDIARGYLTSKDYEEIKKEFEN